VADTEPLFVCVTVVELELDDEAAPVVTDADEVPVFEPLFVLVADPPLLAVLFDPPVALEMSPPLADPSALWLLSFEPLTEDSALLYPELAFADCEVDTSAIWLMLADAPPDVLSQVHVVVSVEDTLPEFVWDALVVDEFDALALPLVTLADDVPVFEPLFVLPAVPPVFPVRLVEPVGSLMLPPPALASAFCSLSLLPLTFDWLSLWPVLAFACWLVWISVDWLIEAAAPGSSAVSASPVTAAAAVPTDSAATLTTDAAASFSLWVFLTKAGSLARYRAIPGPRRLRGPSRSHERPYTKTKAICDNKFRNASRKGRFRAKKRRNDFRNRLPTITIWVDTEVAAGKAGTNDDKC
jgi:hypothetical protein